MSGPAGVFDSGAQPALQAAVAARARGERREARRLAQLAVKLAPGWGQAWILLAALSDPRPALAYLARALELDPHDPVARDAVRRAVHALPAGVRRKVALRSGLPADLAMQVIPLDAMARPRWFSPRVVLPAVLLVGVLALWLGGAPALARPPQAAALQVDKATATATATPTATATSTPTATPIPTETPLPSPTPTPRPNVSWTYSTDPAELADEGRWIDVDLGNQLVTAYEGEQAVRTFLVSTGTRAHPTVTGQFRIYVKYVSTSMGGPGYFLPGVPFTMYYYQGYALHGTYWHNNFGTPMSHGCVNLATPDSEWLFGFASVGTLVNVHP